MHRISSKSVNVTTSYKHWAKNESNTDSHFKHFNFEPE